MNAHRTPDISLRAQGPTIALQPRPKQTMLSYLRPAGAPGSVVTSIARRWGPGDPERCRLCRDCVAMDGLCLVQVGEYVAPEDGALFSKIGRRVQGPPA